MKEKNLFTSHGITESQRFIHTPSNFAKNNLMYVQEAGLLKSITPHRCIREKLDSFLIMIITAGSGVLSVGNSEIRVSMGDVAFIDCNEHYEHISDDGEASWSLAWVHFNGNQVRALYDLFKQGNSDSNIFHVEDLTEWEAKIRSLLELQNDKGILAELQCGTILYSLVTKIIVSATDKSSVQVLEKKDLANEVRLFINDNYSEQDLMNMIVERFAIPINDVAKAFSELMGISIEEYINNRRISSAKEMLRFTVLPVEEIAKKVGIADVEVLQQFFLANEKMSISDYRRMWSQWIKQ